MNVLRNAARSAGQKRRFLTSVTPQQTFATIGRVEGSWPESQVDDRDVVGDGKCCCRIPISLPTLTPHKKSARLKPTSISRYDFILSFAIGFVAIWFRPRTSSPKIHAATRVPGKFRVVSPRAGMPSSFGPTQSTLA
ncbi:hypothetical protein BT63DRAFT_260947 [Microthyrium microscopicum]|uniref:Uncharacterized protein n=1 Tax=Microthyrium microscopicum TaxID=703497 RepID=A0A6A6UCW6_9PEZI|nr:hypothetical protein BT63DRAFT_260947 [Microthyrium microscopicum]